MCGGDAVQLDMSDPAVADAAMKIQAAMQGMLYRQRMSLVDDGDSTDRIVAEDEPDEPDTEEAAPGSQASIRSAQSKGSAQQQEQQASSAQEDTGGQVEKEEKDDEEASQ